MYDRRARGALWVVGKNLRAQAWRVARPQSFAERLDQHPQRLARGDAPRLVIGRDAAPLAAEGVARAPVEIEPRPPR